MKSVTVFCASKNGMNPVYREEAIALGKLLAEKGIKLVYGGGKVGLMGAIADSVLKHGGKVMGIIPELLVEWEHQHTGIQELLVVKDMHERKRLLYEHGDAAIVLPGGFGTLDEMFEMLTWNQLKIHDKKIYLLNSGGFYDGLVMHLKKLEEEGLLYDRLEERVVVVSGVGSIGVRLW